MVARVRSAATTIVRGSRSFEETGRNVVYAVRSMRRNPGFTAVAVLSLALGIGGNLAVFSVVHRLVLTKLPVNDPDHLYQVVVVTNDRVQYRNPFPKFEVMRDHFDIFTALFGWGGFKREVTVGEWKEQLPVVGVTGNYFDALGVRPAIGRLFTDDDERKRESQIAVISHRLWQTALSGDPAVVGRSLSIENATFAIVGVAPQHFTGTEPGAPPGVYLPLHGYERLAPNALAGPGNLWFHAMARLRPDVGLAAAQALLRQRWAELDEANRRRFARNTADALRLEDGSRGYSDARIEFSGAVLVLMGLVGTVFLIACANIATLLFVRGAGRRREMSIRVALGAGRGQLVRQWMTECLVISALGGAAGLVTAHWITRLLLYFVADADRPWLQFEMGGTVVAVSIALTIAAALLCGLLPALRATRVGPEPALRAQAGAVTRRRGAVAQAVLAGQLAASLVLVVGSVLFARTLWNLNTAPAGFDRRAVVYAVVNFNGSTVARDRRGPLVFEALDRLRQSPLVAAASMGTPPILWGGSSFGYVSRVPGYAFHPDEDNRVYTNSAYQGYFDVLRIPLIAGRDFEERDRPSPNGFASAIIVNESFARHYFGDRNPVGTQIGWTFVTTPLEIVGVAKDVKQSMRAPRKDEIYFPIGRGGFGAILARGKPGVDAARIAADIRTAFGPAARQLSLEMAPLEDAVQRSLGRDRLVAQLSAAFGALGILLASIGLYAAIAHTVTSLTREIGIRIALGATRRDVTWMVLRQSLAVTAVGIAIGLPAAIAATRLIGSLLFEVSPSDPLTLAASAGLLALTGLLAGWWPARRAAALDPSRTLRYE